MGTLRSNPKMVFLTIYVCAYLYTSHDRYETHYVYSRNTYSEQNYLGNVWSNYINSLLNCANRFLFINQTHDTTTKRTQLITMQCPLWDLEVLYYIGKEKFRAVWHYSHIARKDLFWKCSLGREKKSNGHCCARQRSFLELPADESSQDCVHSIQSWDCKTYMALRQT